LCLLLAGVQQQLVLGLQQAWLLGSCQTTKAPVGTLGRAVRCHGPTATETADRLEARGLVAGQTRVRPPHQGR